MANILSVAAIVASLLTNTMTITPEKVKDYEKNMSTYYELAEETIPNVIEMYDSDELTVEILEHRDGKIIIERAIGIVWDKEGNGTVLNPADENYNYISYKGVDGAEPGAIFVTYLVYNNENNEIDDIVLRTDNLLMTPAEAIIQYMR